jgi:predicted nucleic acid-binding protein
MTVLVDSDVLIEVSRGRNGEIVPRWLELDETGAAILVSPVTVAELWAGALAHEQNLLRALFGSLICATIDETTGARAGEYLRKYQKSHGVELGDALIAASAVQNAAALWTGNQKHFPMKELRFF